MKLDTMLDEILVSGLDDWVGIWELPRIARLVAGAGTTDEVRDVVLRAVGELLKRGLMETGDVVESGFRSWSMTVDDALQRIEREWLALPDGPRLGDICWLNLTPVGRRLADDIILKGGGP